MAFGKTASVKGLQEPLYLTNQIPLATVELSPYLCPAIVISDSNSTFQLDRQSLDRLRRFQTRTVLSTGPAKASKLYQTMAIELACSVRVHITQPAIYTDISFPA